MSRSPPEARALARIAAIRAELATVDLVCSGTLLKRMKTCGSPTCRCAQDPSARHGPYYEWGHMSAGKLVHRLISSDQAELLRRAIANYRRLRKLLRAWEAETERLIDAKAPRVLEYDHAPRKIARNALGDVRKIRRVSRQRQE